MRAPGIEGLPSQGRPIDAGIEMGEWTVRRNKYEVNDCTTIVDWMDPTRGGLNCFAGSYGILDIQIRVEPESDCVELKSNWVADQDTKYKNITPDTPFDARVNQAVFSCKGFRLEVKFGNKIKTTTELVQYVFAGMGLQ